jgi:hypothetical protein
MQMLKQINKQMQASNDQTANLINNTAVNFNFLQGAMINSWTLAKDSAAERRSAADSELMAGMIAGVTSLIGSGFDLVSSASTHSSAGKVNELGDLYAGFEKNAKLNTANFNKIGLTGLNDTQRTNFYHQLDETNFTAQLNNINKTPKGGATFQKITDDLTLHSENAAREIQNPTAHQGTWGSIRKIGNDAPVKQAKALGETIHKLHKDHGLIRDFNGKKDQLIGTHMASFHQDNQLLDQKLANLKIDAHPQPEKLGLTIDAAHDSWNTDRDFLINHNFMDSEAVGARNLVNRIHEIGGGEKWIINQDPAQHHLTARRVDAAGNELEVKALPSLTFEDNHANQLKFAFLDTSETKQVLTQMRNMDGSLNVFTHLPNAAGGKDLYFIAKNSDDHYMLATIDNGNNFRKIGIISGAELHEIDELYNNPTFLARNQEVLRQVLSHPQTNLKDADAIKTNFFQGLRSASLAFEEQKHYADFVKQGREFFNQEIDSTTRQPRGYIDQLTNAAIHSRSMYRETMRNVHNTMQSVGQAAASVPKSTAESKNANSQFEHSLSGLYSEAGSTRAQATNQSLNNNLSNIHDSLNITFELLKNLFQTMIQSSRGRG